MFFLSLPCPPPGGFLKSRFFSKNRSFTLETLLLASGAEKSIFRGKCFFDPGSVFL